MNVEITGRHIDVTPAIREFTEDKLRKLTRLLDGPLDVHAVLGIEKHRHLAEIQVKARSGTFSGTHETGDLYSSISDVVDKIERQVLKHKAKLQAHKHRKGPRDPETAQLIEEAASAGVGAGATASELPARPRIVRSRGCRMKPCTPEDALMEMEATGDEIVIFRETEDGRTNVMYRRNDGNFGLIESEF